MYLSLAPTWLLEAKPGPSITVVSCLRLNMGVIKYTKANFVSVRTWPLLHGYLHQPRSVLVLIIFHEIMYSSFSLEWPLEATPGLSITTGSYWRLGMGPNKDLLAIVCAGEGMVIASWVLTSAHVSACCHYFSWNYVPIFGTKVTPGDPTRTTHHCGMILKAWYVAQSRCHIQFCEGRVWSLLHGYLRQPRSVLVLNIFHKIMYPSLAPKWLLEAKGGLPTTSGSCWRLGMGTNSDTKANFVKVRVAWALLHGY